MSAAKVSRSVTPPALDLDAPSGVYPSGAHINDLLDLAKELATALEWGIEQLRDMVTT
jgi:hypothetical protein